tara:strand:+ start:354 stop:773 length:420 start_codon:yes stop_codon:yes gene_type:complete
MELPATLGEAIALQPPWLMSYLYVLVAANLGAIFFIVQRTQDGWRPRYEAIAIVVAFLLAGEFMEYLYSQYGYVRLLGLAHLFVWTPVYIWVFTRRKHFTDAPIFSKFVLFYLVMAGISLTIDTIDVARYLLGETGSML